MQKRAAAVLSLPGAFSLCLLLLIVLDILNDIADSLDALDSLVGDLDVKFFFKTHYKINHVKRICAQIVLNVCPP